MSDPISRKPLPSVKAQYNATVARLFAAAVGLPASDAGTAKFYADLNRPLPPKVEREDRPGPACSVCGGPTTEYDEHKGGKTCPSRSCNNPDCGHFEQFPDDDDN